MYVLFLTIRLIMLVHCSEPQSSAVASSRMVRASVIELGLGPRNGIFPFFFFFVCVKM